MRSGRENGRLCRSKGNLGASVILTLLPALPCRTHKCVVFRAEDNGISRGPSLSKLREVGCTRQASPLVGKDLNERCQ